ncbi:ABC transporter ATP-binding protein [Aestuariivita sp.]|jgi:peptide/nickel transport system ATP-binding protein|uniref:ABC transporter ATP-binding protein n=1 Tax=Aestuariivita sp. TaxID=1872407 RepID=UPI00216C80E5|nr:ABC transporter ATP-binding protein [Aestuariivita sp.]MCE8005610.1 ABC transporter ATP-binding protein [Aestuariivita sp.]
MSAYLEITGLNAVLRGTRTRVLRDVSLSVSKGQVHGLVGESGAGKSMIGKAILGVLPRAIEVASGRISLGGQDLGVLPLRERLRVIGSQTAVIPQDPLTALNPSRRIGPQMTDRLTRTLGWQKTRANHRALDLLEEVAIRDPERVLHSYPHELSGGMRQRVLIAAAFAAEPKLIVADEPTTALDVTVQKQILKMIADMQTRHGTTMLFVTHDLGVVARVCQSVSILHSGMVMEEADIRTMLTAPAHPYTAALLAATPRYTDPEASLVPVSDTVLAGVAEAIRASDTLWGRA